MSQDAELLRFRLMKAIEREHYQESQPVFEARWWQFWKFSDIHARTLRCSGLMKAYRIVRDTP